MQWCLDFYIPLVSKPYVNGVSLSQEYIPQKSCQGLGLLAPNRYVIDLSNEVLNIDFDQGAAKKSKVKVEGQKKNLPTWPAPGALI